MPIVYADLRERNSRIVPMLRKTCTVEEQQLAVGDYILSSRVACERKTCDDFIGSIIDQRLFGQLRDLGASFTRPLLIIEGATLFTNRRIHPEALRGALAAIVTDYQIPIIWTETQADTARQLAAIAKREQTSTRRTPILRGKRSGLSDKEQLEFVLAGFPNISTAKAKALLAHFGSLDNVFAASEKELAEAAGVGGGIAKKVRALLSASYR